MYHLYGYLGGYVSVDGEVDKDDTNAQLYHPYRQLEISDNNSDGVVHNGDEKRMAPTLPICTTQCTGVPPIPPTGLPKPLPSLQRPLLTLLPARQTSLPSSWALIWNLFELKSSWWYVSQPPGSAHPASSMITIITFITIIITKPSWSPPQPPGSARPAQRHLARAPHSCAWTRTSGVVSGDLRQG